MIEEPIAVSDDASSESLVSTSSNWRMEVGKTRATNDSRYEIKYVADDFTDESHIAYKENVTVDIKKGEVQLLKSSNTFYNIYEGGLIDCGKSVIQDSDGCYVMTGYTAPYYYEINLLLVKVDNSGKLLFYKTFCGPESDEGNDIIQTSDGGYAIIGTTQSSIDGHDEIWLLKTNNNCEMEWNKTFNKDLYCFGNSIQQTPDGGFIIVGTTYLPGSTNDIWLIKTYRNGSIEWNRTFSRNYADYGNSVILTSDNGYLIVGSTVRFWSPYYQDEDIWLVKTDHSGTVEWEKVYGGGYIDIGYEVQQTSEDSYVVFGKTESNSGREDYWLIKIDNSGNMKWNKTFPDLGGSQCSGSETSDGGYILISSRYDGIEEYNISLVKTDNLGNMLWNKSLGDRYRNFGFSGQETSDKGFIVLGITDSSGSGWDDLTLIKTDKFGNYNLTGNFSSHDMLSNREATSVYSFNYSALIPSGTHGKIQFSQDNITWYNSEISLSGWDEFFNGSNSINLTTFASTWSGLYYRIILSSQSSDVPSIRYINISYYSGPMSDLFVNDDEILTSKDLEIILIEEEIEIFVPIHNIGTRTARNFTIEVWSEPIDQDKEPFEKILINELSGNSSINLTTECSFITWGYHQILIIADPMNNVSESNESNNIAMKELFIYRTAPDLTIITEPDDIIPIIDDTNVSKNGDRNYREIMDGEVFWFEFDIINIGNEHVFNVTVFVLLDDNVSILKVTQWRLGYYGDLKPNSELMSLTTKELLAEYDPTDTGFHKLTIIIDPNNSIKESNESNNILEIENCFKIINSSADDDLDGYLDTWEKFLGTDPLDPNSTPIDTDSDGVPDGDVENSQPWMDIDDDNDNFTDRDELEADTDPLDDEDFPKDKEDGYKSSNYFIFIIAGVVIIMILIMLMILISLKKK